MEEISAYPRYELEDTTRCISKVPNICHQMPNIYQVEPQKSSREPLRFRHSKKRLRHINNRENYVALLACQVSQTTPKMTRRWTTADSNMVPQCVTLWASSSQRKGATTAEHSGIYGLHVRFRLTSSTLRRFHPYGLEDNPRQITWPCERIPVGCCCAAFVKVRRFLLGSSRCRNPGTLHGVL